MLNGFFCHIFVYLKVGSLVDFFLDFAILSNRQHIKVRFFLTYYETYKEFKIPLLEAARAAKAYIFADWVVLTGNLTSFQLLSKFIIRPR